MSSVTDLFGLPVLFIFHYLFAFDRCFQTLLPTVFGNIRKSGSHVSGIYIKCYVPLLSKFYNWIFSVHFTLNKI